MGDNGEKIDAELITETFFNKFEAREHMRILHISKSERTTGA